VKRLLPLVLLVFVPAPSAALADGCPPATCGATSAALPGSRILFVRPLGVQGPLGAYDVVTGSRRYGLPPGRLSADGRIFVSAASAKAPRTTVGRFDARTGKLLSGRSVPGRWSVAGVSASGSRVALSQAGRRTTWLEVGGVRAALHGLFEVEALSPDGRRVFLVHWRRNGYDLQQFDLRSRTLSPTRLDEPDEKMSGTALTAIGTRDGRWLLTLYLKADGNSFVHALDLQSGIGHCIDLPLKGDFITLGGTALALSPDERQLYLASPFLGRVTTIDLGRLRMTQSVRFRPLRVGRHGVSIAPSAAVTPNGRMLAFSGMRSFWLYDIAYGIARPPQRLGSTIRALGFRPDGRSLLAIREPAVPVAFDAASGKRTR
jgi:hypothetical protein